MEGAAKSIATLAHTEPEGRSRATLAIVDWSQIVVAVIAALSVSLGAVVNGLMSGRSDERNRAAEQRRYEDAAERERVLQQRDADEAEQARERELREQESSRGAELEEALRRGLRDVYDFSEPDSESFSTYFESKWRTRLSLAVLPLIGRIRNEDARGRLRTVAEALDDFDGVAEQAYDTPPRRFVEQTMLLGLDLALALVREQEPDAATLTHYRKLVSWMNALEAHRGFQQEMRAEQRREQYLAEKQRRGGGSSL